MMPGSPSATPHPWGHAETPYEELGGAEPARALADAFYDVIEEQSPTLRAMLPASTAVSREKLGDYLIGWLGGPPLYVEKRGHPRLRMRHAPFPIGASEADEWMRCMTIAMDRVGVEGTIRSFLVERLEPLSQHMINR
jgi:hemoglobin